MKEYLKQPKLHPYLIIEWEWEVVGPGVWSKVWVLTIGVLEVNPELDSIRDGLWRTGGAFLD